MIDNELNILQNIVNDHANAVQRAEFNTAAASVHDTGGRSIQAIQQRYSELLAHNDHLEEQLHAANEKLDKRVMPDTAG